MKTLIALLTMLMVLGGCLSGQSTSSTTPASSTGVTFIANTHSSSIVGRAIGSSMTTNVAALSVGDYVTRSLGINTAVAGVGQQISNYDFLAINTNGQVAKIFNYSFPIYSIKTTSSYLIVAGEFTSPTDVNGQALILDEAGKPLQCYLYAIKKSAAGAAGDITCLSKVQVGSYSATLTNNAHYSHLGYDVIGKNVYYTDFVNGSLYKWTEGAMSPVKIFSIVPPFAGTGLDDVFVNQTTGNICALESALTGGTNQFDYGNIYCGTDAGLSVTIQGTSTNEVLAETRALNSYLVTTNQYVDMTTLAVHDRIANGSNGGLPSSDRNVVNIPSGGTVQIAYAWSLSYMDANATTCEVATTNGINNSNGCSNVPQTIPGVYFQTMIGLGNYAWTYGSSNPNNSSTGNYLARFDLTTLSLDTTNYMSWLGMASIIGMATDGLSGNLIVTGLNSAGALTTATIDATTGAINGTPIISTAVDNRTTF